MVSQLRKPSSIFFLLIEEFKDKHSGNVSLIRSEMQERYKAGRDCEAIAEAFRNSNKSDQEWVTKQEKKSDDEKKS